MAFLFCAEEFKGFTTEDTGDHGVNLGSCVMERKLRCTTKKSKVEAGEPSARTHFHRLAWAFHFVFYAVGEFFDFFGFFHHVEGQEIFVRFVHGIF